MAHHKRTGPKSTRAGCLMCKPHKRQGSTKVTKLKGVRVRRKLKEYDPTNPDRPEYDQGTDEMSYP